ncbi:MAG: gluconeogenesis factor YvcK family protein [Clostridia bacterium]|nr:gluconeogenesis factor YvcK family protein [Clostridia bacterium]
MEKYSGLKIVVVGGGTGLSTMLRGLKKYTDNITAIVTVADDGGGSGVLRDDLGILPPGDIRNCILALAETEPLMEKLLSYRFSEGYLSGQSFGNLFLAAMNGICGNFEEAVKNVSDVLKVSGTVLPVTLEDVHINAHLWDGSVIKGECNIPKGLKMGSRRIKRIELVPEFAEILPDAKKAIEEADLIILGPGSVYTSVIPNLIVKGVTEAIISATAPVVYVCNIMTQPGESDEMTAFEHVKAIYNHSRKGIIDMCIANVQKLDENLLESYRLENSAPVYVDEEEFENDGIRLIKGNFVSVKDGKYIRHNYDALAKTIIEECM